MTQCIPAALNPAGQGTVREKCGPRAGSIGHMGPPVPIFVLFLIFFALNVFGQTGTALGQESAAPKLRITMEEAVDRAIKNNLNLQSSQVSVDTMKRKTDLSWNQFVPTVDLGAYLGRLNEAPQATVLPLPPALGGPISMGGGSQWRIGGSLQLGLSLNIAMFESMNRLLLEYRGGLISYEKAKVQLERDIRKQYYQILLLQENISLLRENAAAAERRVTMTEALYRAGMAPELNLLQAKVSAENLKPNIDDAESNLKLLTAQFAMNLGMNFDTEFELIAVNGDSSFIPLDIQELIGRAANSRMDIQEIRQNILVLQSARKAAFYQVYTPSLSLSLNFDPAFGGDPWKDNWFNGDSWSQQSGMLRISLGFRLNGLFPLGQEAQNIADIDDNIRSLNIGLAQAVQGTELEVYNTILSLEKSRASTEAQKRTVELAERTYRLTEEAYRAGFQDLLEVENAELQLRQARLGVLQQNFTYLQGLIDLEYAVGAPFGSLSAGAGGLGNVMESAK
ncbi:MAG: TolC family protein [Treponema sp.]|jgi:outer membrane protein TolC|nr:TolC family protein [Treponema sp.]